MLVRTYGRVRHRPSPLPSSRGVFNRVSSPVFQDQDSYESAATSTETFDCVADQLPKPVMREVSESRANAPVSSRTTSDWTTDQTSDSHTRDVSESSSVSQTTSESTTDLVLDSYIKNILESAPVDAPRASASDSAEDQNSSSSLGDHGSVPDVIETDATAVEIASTSVPCGEIMTTELTDQLEEESDDEYIELLRECPNVDDKTMPMNLKPFQLANPQECIDLSSSKTFPILSDKFCSTQLVTSKTEEKQKDDGKPVAMLSPILRSSTVENAADVSFPTMVNLAHDSGNQPQKSQERTPSTQSNGNQARTPVKAAVQTKKKTRFPRPACSTFLFPSEEADFKDAFPDVSAIETNRRSSEFPTSFNSSRPLEKAQDDEDNPLFLSLSYCTPALKKIKKQTKNVAFAKESTILDLNDDPAPENLDLATGNTCDLPPLGILKRKRSTFDIGGKTSSLTCEPQTEKLKGSAKRPKRKRKKADTSEVKIQDDSTSESGDKTSSSTCEPKTEKLKGSAKRPKRKRKKADISEVKTQDDSTSESSDKTSSSTCEPKTEKLKGSAKRPKRKRKKADTSEVKTQDDSTSESGGKTSSSTCEPKSEKLKGSAKKSLRPKKEKKTILAKTSEAATQDNSMCETGSKTLSLSCNPKTEKGEGSVKRCSKLERTTKQRTKTSKAKTLKSRKFENEPPDPPDKYMFTVGDKKVPLCDILRLNKVSTKKCSVYRIPSRI